MFSRYVASFLLFATTTSFDVRAGDCSLGPSDEAGISQNAALDHGHYGDARDVSMVGKEVEAEIGFVKIDRNITLRRMVVHNSKSEEVLLLLHGFPETLYTWQDLAGTLADDFEIHAFDWPGYGLSSRPAVDKFGYAPRDYARILEAYINKARIEGTKLTIYATDIGALPVLLLALKDPRIAKKIIVGDFAPFNRPDYMHESLQKLKDSSSASEARFRLNTNRDDILENAFRRGLSKEAQFELSDRLKKDMNLGWSQSGITSADAFSYYYSHFTHDQEYMEAHIDNLKLPVTVIWGEKDFYIKKEMGIEFADRIGTGLSIIPGVGHYPHLQNPKYASDIVRNSLR